MGSIFNALNVGYSGLRTSQVAIDTTGHNISNAQNPDYSRQRVEIEPSAPLNTIPGDVGLGAKLGAIVRVHDEFVYQRLKSASTDSEYYNLRQQTMDEISSYFPEIEKNGIYDGLQKYFNAWGDFSKNPDNASLKINLAQTTRTFSETIRNTRSQVFDVQESLDKKLEVYVDEMNRLGKEIAKLNGRINNNESVGNHANDLRDQRDKLELALSKLVRIAVSKGDTKSDTTIDRNLFETGSDYHLNIAGYSFVDGATYHPLVFKRQDGEQFGQVYYIRQDAKEYDMTDQFRTGVVGAVVSLRDGEIQKIVDDLDAFSSTMIRNTNNRYAAHATTSMEGDVEIDGTDVIDNTDFPIDTSGSFYIKIYDVDGNEVAKRKITLTQTATFDDVRDAINASDQTDLDTINARVIVNDDPNVPNQAISLDDNGDGIGSNDVDDFIEADISERFRIHLKSDAIKEQGYTFAIEEVDEKSPSLFAGALGLARFFDGENAKDIYLHGDFDRNPTLIGGNGAPIPGDNQVANAIVEMQYDKLDFYQPYDSKQLYSQQTLSDFFRMSTTSVASTTATAHSNAESSGALLTAVVDEYDSITKVDLDEELTNLMKYQTAYGASAKVITTIDRMIQTLLGMKE